MYSYMIGWLVAFIILIVIEAVTLNLTTIWFALGSAAAYLCAISGLGFTAQFTVFVMVSLVFLFMARPVAVKYVHSHFTKTNVDSLVGQTAKTKSVINNMEQIGAAMLNGLEWSCISDDDSIVIEPDTNVVVTAVSGVKLVVHKKED